MWQNFFQIHLWALKLFEIHIRGCKWVKYQCNLFLFYHFRILNAIFNRLNLRLSQKVIHLNTFFEKLCCRTHYDLLTTSIIQFTVVQNKNYFTRFSTRNVKMRKCMSRICILKTFSITEIKEEPILLDFHFNKYRVFQKDRYDQNR